MRTLYLSFALGLCLIGCSSDMQWATVDKMISLEYPDVEQISTDTLAVWTEDGKNPVLIDTRQRREFEVSHLASALWLHPDSQDVSMLEHLSKDTLIVTYCSVGYRSSRVAEQLQEEGFTNVYNLQGSIFQWANEGRPVYRHGLPVRQVHPYDRLWGQLLNEELHATRPRPVS